MSKFYATTLLFGVVFSCAASSTQGEETRERFFTEIYEKGGWGFNHEGKGFSGSGSTLENAAPYVALLESFIKEHAVESIVDVGCGDWTFSKYVDFGAARYCGFDTVKSVIAQNNHRYASGKVSFIHGDVVELDLPSADLMICKDVLQHLYNEDVVLFLKQLPKYKHCLITNDVDPVSLTSLNLQITGDYRNIDLTAPPFNLKGVKLLTYRSGYVVKQVLWIHRES